MAGIDNNLTLGLGNISFEKELGMYYQDISPSIVHITRGVFANLDEDGIPYRVDGDKKKYYPVVIIQYGLMCYDLMLKGENTKKNKNIIKLCINHLEKTKGSLKDSIVWTSESRKQYNLKDGWVSGMTQGQAISLYLRAYQLFENNEYLETAKKIYNSFKYDFDDGGFKRTDEYGCTWYEEYPTSKPSYVLNGFIYAMFGILDLYRVTQEEKVKSNWDNCVNTLIKNIYKYDTWYWSIYDQAKQQLVSYYYQKNVHIPLMQIMYGLTGNNIFDKYAIKWQKNLNNPIHRTITKIMYRIQPRIKKLKSK